MNPFVTHGAISWSEYLAASPAKALDFYQTLLGWQSSVMPMEAGIDYHILSTGGTSTAGLMARPQDSIPPSWGFYVTVHDVRALVAEHNVRLCVPVTEVPIGTFCGILGPEGGMLYAMEYKDPTGESDGVTDFVSVFTGHGHFSWFELHTPDGAAAAAYYGRLFGWTIEEVPIPSGTYHHIKVGEVGIGGIFEVSVEGAPAYWHGYITVDDVDARTAKAESLGATVRQPPFDLKGVGRMAHIADPFGAPVTLITYEDLTG